MKGMSYAALQRSDSAFRRLNLFLQKLLSPALKRFPSWITPNGLSASRIPLGVVIIFLLTVDYDRWIISSLVLAAGITDMLDGMLAREKQMETERGKTLDRTVDKIFILPVLTAYIFTEIAWILPALFYIIFDSISLYQTFSRLYNNIPLSPSNVIGKLKFIIIFIAILLYPLMSVSWLIDWFLLLPATILAGWSMLNHTNRETKIH